MEEKQKLSKEEKEKIAIEFALKEIEIEKVFEWAKELGEIFANSKIGKIYNKNLEYLDKIF